jgi:hypothetical protein
MLAVWRSRWFSELWDSTALQVAEKRIHRFLSHWQLRTGGPFPRSVSHPSLVRERAASSTLMRTGLPSHSLYRLEFLESRQRFMKPVEHQRRVDRFSDVVTSKVRF